jgi:5-methylcytosine-specific restriction endonuclease McrA
MAVLLLDSTYEPLSIISWEAAMTLVMTKDAEVIVESEANLVRTTTVAYKMPSVIRQFKKYKRKEDVKFSRINIYMRDGWSCQYCGQKKSTKELTFDHVIPRDKGGPTTWENIVAACRPCNHWKANRTPAQAKMKLTKKPVKPKWLPQQMVLKMKNLPKLWEPYIDAKTLLYWTSEAEGS